MAPMNDNKSPAKAQPQPACGHASTRLIAKDDAAEYMECLDCGEILEASEMQEAPEFPESLSDA